MKPSKRKYLRYEIKKRKQIAIEMLTWKYLNENSDTITLKYRGNALDIKNIRNGYEWKSKNYYII